MVLFMLCSAVLIEWLLLKPCCVEICGMLFVVYGSSVLSSVFAITERSEMARYDVHMFMSLFGFGMMLLFSDVLYMLVIYASPSGSMCLRCMMWTFIRPCLVVFALFYCRLVLCCGECYFGCLQFVGFSIYVFVLCGLCLTVLVNCLLNVFAICVGEVSVFLKVIMLFFGLCWVFCWLIRVWSSKLTMRSKVHLRFVL